MKARWAGRVAGLAAALVSACALASAWGAGASLAGDPHPYTGSDQIIYSSSVRTSSVTLHVIGSQGGTNSGFNFNGFANGDMIIKVPEGWTVNVDYRVDTGLAHSAIIVPWSQRQGFTFTLAFPGAGIPNYTNGINKHDPPAHFSFVADKAGRYALVCAVPGHDEIGMWDQFDVVSGLAKPEVLVK